MTVARIFAAQASIVAGFVAYHHGLWVGMLAVACAALGYLAGMLEEDA